MKFSIKDFFIFVQWKLDITHDKKSCLVINVHAYPKRKQKNFNYNIKKKQK